MAEEASVFSYDHIGIEVGKTGDFDAVAGSGSVSLTENVYLSGFVNSGSKTEELGNGTSKKTNMSEYTVSLGAHNDLTQFGSPIPMDVFYQAGYRQIHISDDLSVNDGGLTVKTGLKTNFNIPAIELTGYTGFDRDNHSNTKNEHFFGSEVNYFFSDEFSLGLDYTHKVHEKAVFAKFDYHF